MNKEFDLENFVVQEKMMLDTFEEAAVKKSSMEPAVIESSGPVASAMEIEMQKEKVNYYTYLRLDTSNFIFISNVNFSSKLKYSRN